MSRTTIVGVATGRPDGGVAVVRVSGPAALRVAGALVPSLPSPRHVGLRRLVGGVAGEQALVLVMLGPRSFTGEDVVEFHVHAGRQNVESVVRALEGAGAVAAGAGEFSRRAFEHGRMSLDEAEGLAAIIGARTEAELRLARRLAQGELGRAVQDLCARLERLRVEVEVNLDFPEDVEEASALGWRASLEALSAELGQWAARFEAGRRAGAPARVVIAGPPNAGKSSLFNALLETQRSLVAEVPGTTRDFVEMGLGVGGAELTLVDTAGLRRSEDAVEAAGIELARAQLGRATVVLWVEASDAEDAGSEEALGEHEGPVLRVETKRDLGARRAWLGVSARSGEGVAALRLRIADLVGDRAGEAWAGLSRHAARTGEAAEALVRAARSLDAGALELVAFELASAERALGEITGRGGPGPVGAEVLDAIFSSFCIGK